MIVEQIKAELRRRMLEDYNSGDEEKDAIAQGVCAGMITYIDSMQEEPTGKDLEEEIIKYITEKMVANAIPAKLGQNNIVYLKYNNHPFHVGDKVKVIVIKEK